jgi:hypothetical protein
LILEIVIDRRGEQRLQLDAQLADLQSELEAGARLLERIATEAGRVDHAILSHARKPGIAADLIREISELRRCIAQQRATLAELLGQMRMLRKNISETPR